MMSFKQFTQQTSDASTKPAKDAKRIKITQPVIKTTRPAVKLLAQLRSIRSAKRAKTH